MRRASLIALFLAVTGAAWSVFNAARIELAHAQVSVPTNFIPRADALLIRSGRTVRAFNALANTDAARGTALRNAVAASTSGDLITIAPATFSLGTTGFSVPAGVKLQGSGWTSKLTSACPIGTSYCVKLGNNAVLEDVWVEGSLANGTVQAPVGPDGNSVTFTLRRVKITGDSDALYMWDSAIVCYAYDCWIESKFDAVVGLGSGATSQTIHLVNCDLVVNTTGTTVDIGDGFGLDHYGTAINMRGGACNVHNCRVNISGKATSVGMQAVRIHEDSTLAVVNFQNSSVTLANGLARHDFRFTGTGTINVSGGKGSSTGGLYAWTGGTPTFENGFPQSFDAAIYRSGRVVQGFNAAANTNAARGTALLAAITASSSGDTIRMGPGTFDMDTNAVVIGAGRSLIGAGMWETVIESDYVTNGQTKTQLQPEGNKVTLKGFSFVSTIAGASSGDGVSIPFGSLSATTGFTNLRMEDVRIYGDTDALWYTPTFGGNSSMEANNCRFEGKWDCFRWIGVAGDVARFRNCTFTITTPDANGFTAQCRVLQPKTGTFYFENCYIHGNNQHASGTQATLLNTETGGNASCYFRNCAYDLSSVSATTVREFQLAHTGTQNIFIEGGLATRTTDKRPECVKGALYTATLKFLDGNNNGQSRLIGWRLGCNFNSTADQAIPITCPSYVIESVVVKNASVNMTAADGGIYTATSKGGTAVVPAATVYTELTSSSKYKEMTRASGLDSSTQSDVFTVGTLYLSLTGTQGAAATADVYVIGRDLSNN